MILSTHQSDLTPWLDHIPLLPRPLDQKLWIIKTFRLMSVNISKPIHPSSTFYKIWSKINITHPHAYDLLFGLWLGTFRLFLTWKENQENSIIFWTKQWETHIAMQIKGIHFPFKKVPLHRYYAAELITTLREIRKDTQSYCVSLSNVCLDEFAEATLGNFNSIGTHTHSTQTTS